jgi:hypothetical protein
MRGADSLIALRMRGYAPAMGVVLEVCEGRPTQHDDAPGVALLQVETADSVERLDLRCLVGLKVVAYGAAGCPSDERINAVARRAAKWARRVVAFRESSDDILFDSEAA